VCNHVQQVQPSHEQGQEQKLWSQGDLLESEHLIQNINDRLIEKNGDVLFVI